MKWMDPVRRLPRPLLSPAELRHRRSRYHPLLHAPRLDEAEEDATCRSRKRAGSQSVLMAQVARVGKRGWFVGECALMLVEESLASRLQLGEDVVRRDGQPCPSRRSASLKSIMLKSRVVRYAS